MQMFILAYACQTPSAIRGHRSIASRMWCDVSIRNTKVLDTVYAAAWHQAIISGSMQGAAPFSWGSDRSHPICGSLHTNTCIGTSELSCHTHAYLIHILRWILRCSSGRKFTLDKTGIVPWTTKSCASPRNHHALVTAAEGLREALTELGSFRRRLQCGRLPKFTGRAESLGWPKGPVTSLLDCSQRRNLQGGG